MSYKVKTTADFDKSAKQIAKKHKYLKESLGKLIGELEKDPLIGTDLGHGLYKIRLSIAGTNKGKSGGARVITCVVLVSSTVYLAEIYLKSDHETVDANLVLQRLKDQGII